MIVGLRGRVRAVEPGGLSMSVGPVDVRVAVPPEAAAGLTLGDEVELYTHLHVREDQLALFGFRSAAELTIFEMLLGVSGVGPKMAMAVVGGLGPAEVRRAIAQGDAASLARAPGLGARVAARIVSDLQGKIPAAVLEPRLDGADVASTVVSALISMGYPMGDARRAVEGVSSGASVEDALRAALSALADR